MQLKLFKVVTKRRAQEGFTMTAENSQVEGYRVAAELKLIIDEDGVGGPEIKYKQRLDDRINEIRVNLKAVNKALEAFDKDYHVREPKES